MAKKKLKPYTHRFDREKMELAKKLRINIASEFRKLLDKLVDKHHCLTCGQEIKDQ